MTEFAHGLVRGMSDFDVFFCRAALVDEAAIVLRFAVMYWAQCT